MKKSFLLDQNYINTRLDRWFKKNICDVFNIGNPNSISDVGVAADVALAGVRGASMNVLINLPNIQDEVYCNNKRKAVEKLIQDAETNRNIVFDKTMKIINP